MKGLFFLLLCFIVGAFAKDYCLPTESCWPSDTQVSILKGQLAATQALLTAPGDEQWAGKALTFNQRVAQMPGLIAYVGTVDQVRLIMKFCQFFNIRLSIVSSGHSFPGRNTAAGSFQMSIRYMESASADLKCALNSDGCLVVQPGVQWLKAYKIAGEAGRVVVGGNAPTVSVTGWTIGGGHSILSRMFGLGVHNVLEFTLITADLSLVTTSAAGTKIQYENGTVAENSDTDLFWALRGGGSSFGVIMEMKIKLHKPSDKYSQMVCYYTGFQDGTPKMYEVILKKIGNFMKEAPNMFGGYLIPSVSCDRSKPDVPCTGSFLISMGHFGSMASDYDWVKKATELPHDFLEFQPGGCQLKEFDTYYDYAAAVVDATYTESYIAGQLIPKDRFTDEYVETLSAQFNRSFYEKIDLSATLIALGGAVSNHGVGEAAIHPGWQSAIFTAAYGAPVKEGTAQGAISKANVKETMVKLAKFGYGKYYNEAEDDMTSDMWKREFWGMPIYNSLLAVKKRWDNNKMFTCIECVGADWEPSLDVIG